MVEEQVKEIPEGEINLSFSIKSVKVEVKDNLGRYNEFYKLYVDIKEPRLLEQGEINYQVSPIPEKSLDEILKDIRKLYSVYIFTQNEKLEEAIREEILKLIALLIWVLG